MSKYLPWQSWSPARPNIFGLPTWDYCPLPRETQRPNHYELKPTKKPISYWCSWYAFGEKISEKIILEQACLLNKNKSGIEYILIDDGWTKWGDWNHCDQAKFPSGLTVLSQNLASMNLKTGLWLAPFLAAPNSQLFKNHPDYFLRNKKGKMINGFRSIPPLDGIFKPRFLLDFAKKEVREYIFHSLDQMIEKWNISLLKLDFLYAPYFNPNFEQSGQASKQVQELLFYLKKRHPQVFTIACGCPFSDAHGLADAVRISKDITAPQPLPKIFRKILYRSRVKMLEEKLDHQNFWQGCLADPDVRVVDLDNKNSSKLFNKLEKIKKFIRGLG